MVESGTCLVVGTGRARLGDAWFLQTDKDIAKSPIAKIIFHFWAFLGLEIRYLGACGRCSAAIGVNLHGACGEGLAFFWGHPQNHIFDVRCGKPSTKRLGGPEASKMPLLDTVHIM